MRFFQFTRVFKFMRIAPYCAGLSAILVAATLVALVWPGPRLGPDFVGGTEIEVEFAPGVAAPAIEKALSAKNFTSPDVIKVETAKGNRYIVRVRDISTIGDETKRQAETRVCFSEGPPSGACAEVARPIEVKWSPGGEKLTIRYDTAPNLDVVRQQLTGIAGITIAPGEHNPVLQEGRQPRVEVRLLGTGDKLRQALIDGLGQKQVGEMLRDEWIGPKAGAQLRNAAITSLAITLVLIMAYVAMRFDLRFSPGAVLCLAHDALIAAGALMVLGREFNLGTVAALLTIVGFSVNDTVVIYDRVRENIHRHPGMSFPDLIDLSVSEMLGRTILTSATAILSLLAFFLWGTGSLKDFSLTLIIGMISGVYSTVYVALPLTHWLDKLFFAKVAKQKKKTRSRRVQPQTKTA